MESQLSTCKKIAFWGIIALLLLFCLELFSFVVLHRFIPSRVRNRAAFKTAEDYVTAYKKSAANRIQSDRGDQAGGEMRMFHPTLGWDYPPNAEYSDSRGVRYHHGAKGERRTCTSFDTDMVATYGDSFTYCSDEEDCHSWQTYLAEEIRANVLNFGVAGYGTDQAYLKYELNAAGVSTPVVMLGILPDDINRVVNSFRTFYAPDAVLALTKPRYVSTDHGYELLPNPLASARDTVKLEDPAFVRKLGENDYWYQRDRSLPRVGIPYAVALVWWRKTLLEHLRFDLGLPRRVSPDRFYPGNLFEEKEPLRIMCHVVDLFVRTSKARHSHPVIVLMPHRELVQETMKHRVSRIDTLAGYLKERGYPHIDLIREMADMQPTKDQLHQWFREHATPEGNKIIAHIMARYLEREGLLPGKDTKSSK